jgi:hypothetical protein
MSQEEPTVRDEDGKVRARSGSLEQHQEFFSIRMNGVMLSL